MTKAVRIENADTSPRAVLVQTWSKGYAGGPDKFVGEQRLEGCADLGAFLVHRDQYLVVKEADD